MKNARAPAVINHCSSCKRQDSESGPSKPGSGYGSLIGNWLDIGAPLAQWMMRIASRGLCICIFVSNIGVVIAGYSLFLLFNYYRASYKEMTTLLKPYKVPGVEVRE